MCTFKALKLNGQTIVCQLFSMGFFLAHEWVRSPRAGIKLKISKTLFLLLLSRNIFFRNFQARTPLSMTLSLHDMLSIGNESENCFQKDLNFRNSNIVANNDRQTPQNQP